MSDSYSTPTYRAEFANSQDSSITADDDASGFIVEEYLLEDVPLNYDLESEDYDVEDPFCSSSYKGFDMTDPASSLTDSQPFSDSQTMSDFGTRDTLSDVKSSQSVLSTGSSLFESPFLEPLDEVEEGDDSIWIEDETYGVQTTSDGVDVTCKIFKNVPSPPCRRRRGRAMPQWFLRAPRWQRAAIATGAVLSVVAIALAVVLGVDSQGDATRTTNGTFDYDRSTQLGQSAPTPAPFIPWSFSGEVTTFTQSPVATVVQDPRTFEPTIANDVYMASDVPTGVPSVTVLNTIAQPSASPVGFPPVEPVIVPDSEVQPTAEPVRFQPVEPIGVVNPTSPPTTATSTPTVKLGPRTEAPTVGPTTKPTATPSELPGSPTGTPTMTPTLAPTRTAPASPTGQPTVSPSRRPTPKPSTYSPTSSPSSRPTGAPSLAPQPYPTRQPVVPIYNGWPTRHPVGPTMEPRSTPAPTLKTQAMTLPPWGAYFPGGPWARKTAVPTISASEFPSEVPSDVPSDMPSSNPTLQIATVVQDVRATQAPMLATTDAETLSTSGGVPTPGTTQAEVSTIAAAPTTETLPASSPILGSAMTPAVSNAVAFILGQDSVFLQTYGNLNQGPTQSPTMYPTIYFPRADTTDEPSGQPTNVPTVRPSREPTRTPTKAPTRRPTRSPTRSPTRRPTQTPSMTPSALSSAAPTLSSNQPSDLPSSVPSSEPTTIPFELTVESTGKPTVASTDIDGKNCTTGNHTTVVNSTTALSDEPPTLQQTIHASGTPSDQPSDMPSSAPSIGPTSIRFEETIESPGKPAIASTEIHGKNCTTETHETAANSTLALSDEPSTPQPTMHTSSAPSASLAATPQPTIQASSAPSAAMPDSTMEPSPAPSLRTVLTSAPTESQATATPTLSPTLAPTATAASSAPSSAASQAPTAAPTGSPTVAVTKDPTASPTVLATESPTLEPTPMETAEATEIED